MKYIMLRVHLKTIMGYTGELNITGTADFKQTQLGVDATLNLSGLESNREGMWHVHKGTCVDPGLHVTVADYDPFNATNWTSNVDGTHISTTGLQGITLDPLKGTVFIIHDSEGVKAACGEIVEVLPGCGEDVLLSTCTSEVKALTSSGLNNDYDLTINIDSDSNKFVLQNKDPCQGVTLKSIQLIMENKDYSRILQTFHMYAGFNSTRTTPIFLPLCFSPNEGFIAASGTFEYDNFLPMLEHNHNSLKSNTTDSKITLRHGTFVQDVGSAAQSVDAIGPVIGNKTDCPRPAPHQVNMCSATSKAGDAPVDEGEFKPSDVYTQQDPTVVSLSEFQESDYWIYTSLVGNLIPYPTVKDPPVNYAWIASAYNIYNFKKTAIENHNKISNYTDSIKKSGIVAKLTSYRNISTSRITQNGNDIIYKYKNLGGYTCIPGTPNNQALSTNQWGILPQQDSVEAYKNNLLQNLNDAMKENTKNYGCGVVGTAQWGTTYQIAAENSWVDSVFYIGEDLPYLQQYKDIEDLNPKETNYGGKYIQLQWKTTVYHPSRTIELYITRGNQYTRINSKTDTDNIDIQGNLMNGLVSYSDTYGHALGEPTLFINIPLFALHRALSMGPNSFIGTEIKQDPQALYNLGETLNIFHGIFMWPVLDAQYWQQPFNLIFTNQVSWAPNFPKIITANSDSNQYTKQITQGRLYQWGHYTLRLDDWKYPPSGWQSSDNQIKAGALTNEIDKVEAFDKKYAVTDPWGVYSNDMRANFFQTFNNGGQPSAPTLIVSASGQHHTPAPTPPAPPPPAPPPPASTACTSSDLPNAQSACCKTSVPDKKALKWKQATYKEGVWYNDEDPPVKLDGTAKTAVDVYNCSADDRIPCGISCPWNVNGTWSTGENNKAGFYIAQDLGSPGSCDNAANPALQMAAACDYKPGCWVDKNVDSTKRGACKTIKPSSLIHAELKHSLLVLDKNGNLVDTHHFTNKINLDCINKSSLYLTFDKKIFNSAEHTVIADTRYTTNKFMRYIAAPNTMTSSDIVNMVHKDNSVLKIQDDILHINLDNLNKTTLSNNLLVDSNNSYTIKSINITDTNHLMLGFTGGKILLSSDDTLYTIPIPYTQNNSSIIDMSNIIRYKVSNEKTVHNYMIYLNHYDKPIISHTFGLLNKNNMLTNIQQPEIIEVSHIKDTIRVSLNINSLNKYTAIKYTTYLINKQGVAYQVDTVINNNNNFKSSDTYLEKDKWHSLKNNDNNVNLDAIIKYTNNKLDLDIKHMKYIEEGKYILDTKILHKISIRINNKEYNMLQLTPYKSHFVESLNNFHGPNMALDIYKVISHKQNHSSGTVSIINYIIKNIIFNEHWSNKPGALEILKYYSLPGAENSASQLSILVNYVKGNSSGSVGIYNYTAPDNKLLNSKLSFTMKDLSEEHLTKNTFPNSEMMD